LTSTTLGGISSVADIDREALPQKSMADMPLRSLLIPSIVIPIANYAMLAFLDISLIALLPLFFSTPTYLGGLGFTPSSIGSWLAMFGVADGLFQAFFFAKFIDRLGPKRIFRFSVSCFAPAMTVFPIMSWLVHTRGAVDHAITVTLIGQLVLIVLWDMAFGAYYDRKLPVIIIDPLINYSVCLHVYHGFRPYKERPWRYQWSRPDHRVDVSCRWARLSDFALCIFKRTQSSQWKRSICHLHYTEWCIDVVGIAFAR
jgi:hypothetical protein